MISLDGKNLALIGGVAAAVLAGIYVVWGPSESRQRKRNRRVICPGLVNLGNTCFLNAVLQALAPCASVGHWLTSIVERKRSSAHYLAPTLQNIVKVLNNDSVEFTEEYCPSDVIQALQTRGWVISSDEQDAHEMFHVLTETLSEETTPCSRILPLFDVSGLEETCAMPKEEAVNRIGVDVPVMERNELENAFYGLLASQLQCKQCGFKCAIKYDSFDSLSLSLPSQYSGPLSLEQLFRRFVMLESVDEVVCERCTADSLHNLATTVSENKLKRSSFVKKLTIGKLPRCLCIHIQRTVWLDSGIPMKRCDSVSFPEILDMSPYVYHKYPSPKVRPTTLSIDATVRLVGGRQEANNTDRTMSRMKSSSKSSGKTSPTGTKTPVLSPNSGQVNMLKALNYHSRIGFGGDGLYAASRGCSSVKNKPTPGKTRELQILAAAYSSENSPPSSTKYKLVSVVCHLGDVMSGHFVTYRRAPSLNGRRFPDDWLYTSDVVVRRAPLAEVLAANAYMLMYEKL